MGVRDDDIMDRAMGQSNLGMMRRSGNGTMA